MKNDYTALPKRQVKKLRISNFFSGINSVYDESVLSQSVAGEIYNFDFSTGVLRSGRSIEDFGIEKEDISYIWFYNRFDGNEMKEILMFSDFSGNIYYLDEEIIQLYGVNIQGKICAVNYRLYGDDVIMLCSDQSPMVVWDGLNAPISVTNSPRLTSLAMHNERLFVADADGQNLRFSDDLDPTNWNSSLSEGGSIELVDDKGRINKVVSFLNYLFIFRDYGICRLSAGASQTEFKVTNLFVTSGRIYPDTVALCGDRIIFLSGDGLFSFDGYSVKKIFENLDGMLLASPSAVAGYGSGKYYLAVKINQTGEPFGCETGEFVNNGVLAFDVNTGDYSIMRGADVNGFAVSGSRVLTLCNGKVGQITKEGATYFGTALRKRWRSPMTDLGSEQMKLIKEIYLDFYGEISFTVKTEEKEMNFLLCEKDRMKRIRVGMKAKKVAFIIETQSEEPCVSRPTIIFSVL